MTGISPSVTRQPERARPARRAALTERRRCAGGSPNDLVERHLGLAETIARRYRRTSEPFDDLLQVARIGLVNAARRWDPDRGVAFSAYAVPTITGEIRRYFRDRAWTVRPPRPLQELYLRVQSVRENLWQELAREPTAQEVATRLGRPLDDVLEALEAADAYHPISLDTPVRTDEAGSATRQDFLAERRDELERCVEAITLEQLAADLSQRDREVIRLRFQEDLIQREIAARVGISQMHVSRILRDAVRSMLRVADQKGQ